MKPNYLYYNGVPDFNECVSQDLIYELDRIVCEAFGNRYTRNCFLSTINYFYDLDFNNTSIRNDDKYNLLLHNGLIIDFKYSIPFLNRYYMHRKFVNKNFMMDKIILKLT